MELVAIVIGLALLQYMYISFQVGAARGKYDVPAPATTGDPIFERHYRVQMNTLEQLAIFLPGMVLFAHFVSPQAAAALGLVFILGRALYMKSYVADPQKRSAGFMVTFLPNVILVLGTIIGAAVALF